MIRDTIVFLLMFTAFVTLSADDHKVKKPTKLTPHFNFNDDSKIYMYHGSVIVLDDAEEEMVEITEDNELIVNGKQIEMTDEQKELTWEYYDLVSEVIRKAKRIGWEGAKIGLDGAKVGLKAVVGVFKLILPGYGPDDLERDMEMEADKIEAKADVLEQKAEKLEVLVDRIEEIHEELKEITPELKELGWF